jgi:hypothetical protein
MRRLAAFLILAFAVPLFAQYGPPPPPGQQPWVYGPNPQWNSSWNKWPNPRRGACFFTSQGFRGNRFCVRSGDKLPALPGNFGGNLSSIQVYGGATVRVSMTATSRTARQRFASVFLIFARCHSAMGTPGTTAFHRSWFTERRFY